MKKTKHGYSDKDTPRPIARGSGARSHKILIILFAAAAAVLIGGVKAGAVDFSAPWVGTFLETSQAVAWGDFNNDGRQDILVANNGSLRMYTKDAGNSFTSAWTVSVPGDDAFSLAVGDFDGNGWLDFFAGNNSSSSRVYRNNADNTFTAVWSTPASDPTHSVAVGDVNGDGSLDLVAGNFGSASKIYTNTGLFAWTALAWTTTVQSTESVALGDINNDGRPDLLTGNYTQSKIVYKNNGDGTFTQVWQSAETDQTKCVAFGDYNGDGYADFAVGNNNQANRVYKNNGDETFSLAWTSGSSFTTKSVAWGDYEGDGDLDLLIGNFSQANYVYKKDVGDVFTQAFATTETDATAAVTWLDADIDGDLDFVSANTTAQGTRLYINNLNPSNLAPQKPTLIAASNTVPGPILLSWNSTTDDHTPGNMLGYYIKVGTSSGANNVISGFYTGYPGNNRPGATSRSVNIASDGTYYWSVAAVDATGFKLSALSNENSFIIDSSPPTTGAVVIRDGTAADIAYATSSTQLSANWSGFSDPQTGIALYQYAIGTATSANNIIDWTDNGTNAYVTHTGLSLLDGVTYYFAVKAKNSSGLWTSVIKSNGQLVDTTPPVSVASVNDGTAADVSYTIVNNQLSANWTASSDPHSGIIGYWYAIGSTAGAADVAGWTYNAGTSVTRAGAYTLGSTYFISVRAQNNAGLYQPSATVSNGQKVDTTAPANIATIYRGSATGVDFAFSASTTQISANWTPSTDTESGVAKYWYTIGTSAGGSEITGWTDNAADTSVTKTGLALTNGFSYYISVKAENGAGLQSAVITSAAIKVDTTPPADIATVSDGAGLDIIYTTTNSQLSANWTASSDSESGISKYWYAIGTTIGGSNIAAWTDNGLATSVTKSGLSLANGIVYYFTVKAENNAGAQSILTTSSNGQQVDITPPVTISSVNDGTGADIAFQPSATTLNANWPASSDPETGVVKYWYAVGTTSGATDIRTWTDNGAATSVAINALALTTGQIYFVSVKAENAAGLQSVPTNSNGVTIDISPPSNIATVKDGTSVDITYTTNNSQLSANWTTSSDPTSGVAKYWYAIGTLPGANNFVNWTDNGTSASVTRTGLGLINGTTYYMSVKAENGAGLQSAVTSSNGQLVDITPPDIVAVFDGAGLDITYTTVNTELTANWTPSADSQSGIKKYWYTIGTSPGGSEVVGWTDNALNVSVTKTGLNLPNGFIFYFSVKAENNAGLFSNPATSNGQKVDTTPPAAIAYVYDSAGADVNYITVDNSISANWAATTDGETGVVRYWYAIGTTPGGTQLAPWTDNALNTSITLAPALANGATYYTSVKAENDAGLQTAVVTSNGQMVDTTAPDAVATVNDGPNDGIDRSYTTNGAQLACNWPVSLDPQSGTKRYWYAFGTTAGGTDIVPWSDNGLNAIVVVPGLTLTNGLTYYCSVKVENNASLVSAPVNSNGILVDIGYPTDIETVNDGPGADIDYISSTTQLTANWTPSTDSQSGIKNYWYSIGTTPGGMTVSGGWINNGLATSVTHTGLTLVQGQIYYFRVKAENNAGLQTTLTTSNGQKVDTIPPGAPATVNDGIAGDTAYDISNTSISANWTASVGGISGIAKYWFAVGSAPGLTDIVGWTDIGNVTVYTHTGLSLANGSVYYISIKAESWAGVQSTVTVSNGQKVDITPPDVVSVSDGTAADVTYTTTALQLSANWTASDDSESGVAKYWYAIGTTAGGTDIVGWTDNGVSVSVTKTGLTLVNGTIYYFSVKAENAAGLQAAAVNSNGQKVDITPPADVASVNDGTAADIVFETVSNTQISANWAASSDAESGVAKYWYAIGSAAGATNTLNWTDIGTNVSVTKTGLTLADGTRYYFSVKAENGAGLISTPVNSNGQMVDVSPPADVAAVSDGTGADIAFATSLTTLSSNWTPSTDPHTGVAKYWYAIGTTTGGTDVVGWTDNGTNVSVTKGGLTLSNGAAYYFTVKAENGAGLLSTPVNSNGQTADTTPPAAVASVSDGVGADIAYNSSSASISANWPASSDAQSGIAAYWYAIGTTPGGSDAIGWTNNGLNAFVTRSGLTLSQNTSYYFVVKVENGAGLFSATTNSNGQKIDVTPPSNTAAVNDGTGADSAFSTVDTSLSANWNTSFDAESGINKYWYAIGTSPGGSDTVGWTDNALDVSVTKTDLGLANGQSYYFTVKAENNSGLMSAPISSNGLMIDVTAPDLIPYVFDGPGPDDAAYASSTAVLSAKWNAATDDQSGIAKYFYAIGSAPGGTDIVPWTDNGANLSVTKSGLSLTEGAAYYFTVKSVNNAGIESAPTNSNGAVIDVTQPPQVAAVYDGTGADVSYTTSAAMLSANWAASSDPQSGIAKYYYAIGSTPGGTNIAGWTDIGAATGVTRAGLTLTDGQTYYFSVKALNGASLFSSPAASNGQKVDISHPTPVIVSDGLGADISYTRFNDHLSANWTASSAPNSGISKYYYSIGTTPGGIDVSDWTDNGPATSVSLTGLSLTDGRKYYFSVKAESLSGLQSSPAISDGQTVDASPPGDIASVSDGPGADIRATTSASSLSANWTASTETNTPFVYIYSIGTTAGATDVADWASTTARSALVSSLSLSDGATYFFNVKARNSAGLESGVTSSNGASVNLLPPAAAITSPAQNATVSDSVSISGSATDLTLAEWKLEYGPGSSPTLWRQIASGTNAVSDGAFTVWDTASLAGQYTLKLTVSDTLDGLTTVTTTFTIQNTVTITGSIPAGEWVLLSLPASPPNANPVSLFGENLTYKILRWDPTATDDPTLSKYRSPGNIGAGASFWIKSFSGAIPYSYQANAANTAQDSSIQLKSGWNQIGCPFNRAFPWNQVRVSNGAGTYDLTTAAGMNLISTSIYSFNPATNSWSVNDINTQMQPQTGYFVNAPADVSLLFAPGAGLPDGMARVVMPAFDYSIRISAAAKHSADPDNFIGASNFAADASDAYDAPEPPPSPNAAFTRLYFPHGDWPVNPGSYAADFRASSRTAGESQNWLFNADTSEAGESVTISWDNSALPSDKYSFTLVDLDTGERIDMAARNSYSYIAPANAAPRHFKIEALRLQAPRVTATHTLEAGWNLVSIPIEPDVANALALLGKSLPILNLHQYYGGKFYPADQADIQSGLGYWIYVAENTSISIPGSAVAEDEQISVPLKKGWNLIGNPFDAPLAWSDNISVVSGGVSYALSAARAAGLVSENLFLFDGASYTPLASGARLEPWRGYFLKAGADCSVILKK